MLLLVGVFGAAVGAGGCATALNMQDVSLRKPYGGFTMPVDDFFGGEPAGEYTAVRFWPLWLLDKPLSLCADTLTLPYVLWLRREAESAPKPQGVPPPYGPPPEPSARK
jgi:hypothetical protein